MQLVIAFESLKSRRKSVFLAFLSLLISVSVLISVEYLRLQAKQSFNRTISGVDLIVGAPSGQLNLLLYSVFRMGNPTQSIQLASYRALSEHPQVEWIIPISLGDSHRGFRVLGTSVDYFDHYKFGNKQSLTMLEGEPFEFMFEAVIGSDVARELNYQVGDSIIVAHGLGEISFAKHDHAPFTIVGILQPTGTPVDKTVHVDLASIEAIHIPPRQLKSMLESGQDLKKLATQLQPKTLSAMLVGLQSRMAVFGLQRQINDYKQDRLMAILPGVALAELWQIMRSVEQLLLFISGLVLLSSLCGLAVMLLASMRERRREIALLRVIGATPLTIFSMVMIEAMLITVLAIFSALVSVSMMFYFGKDWLAVEYGLFIEGSVINADLALVCGSILVAAMITTLLPAIEAYRNALHLNLADSN
jgi:putative ABC transport system permease protein